MKNLHENGIIFEVESSSKTRKPHHKSDHHCYTKIIKQSYHQNQCCWEQWGGWLTLCIGPGDICEGRYPYTLCAPVQAQMALRVHKLSGWKSHKGFWDMESLPLPYTTDSASLASAARCHTFCRKQHIWHWQAGCLPTTGVASQSKGTKYNKNNTLALYSRLHINEAPRNLGL